MSSCLHERGMYSAPNSECNDGTRLGKDQFGGVAPIVCRNAAMSGLSHELHSRSINVAQRGQQATFLSHLLYFWRRIHLLGVIILQDASVVSKMTESSSPQTPGRTVFTGVRSQPDKLHQQRLPPNRRRRKVSPANRQRVACA